MSWEIELIKKLLGEVDISEWWPVYSESYRGKIIEIVIGCILLPSTPWSRVKNCVREIVNRYGDLGKINVESISIEGLEEILRKCGIVRAKQKAEYLYDALVKLSNSTNLEEDAEKLKGIGELGKEYLKLWAFSNSYLPNDKNVRIFLEKYTSRKFEEIKEELEEKYKGNPYILQLIFALAFEFSKNYCKKSRCEFCFLKDNCKHD